MRNKLTSSEIGPGGSSRKTWLSRHITIVSIATLIVWVAIGGFVWRAYHAEGIRRFDEKLIALFAAERPTVVEVEVALGRPDAIDVDGGLEIWTYHVGTSIVVFESRKETGEVVSVRKGWHDR